MKPVAKNNFLTIAFGAFVPVQPFAAIAIDALPSPVRATVAQGL